MFIERNEFISGSHRRFSTARKIQIVLGDLSDILIGLALLYLCYNNAKFAIKKQKRKHRRFLKKMQRVNEDGEVRNFEFGAISGQ